jgi:hypothetical protein
MATKPFQKHDTEAKVLSANRRAWTALIRSSPVTYRQLPLRCAARQSRWESRDNQDENAPLPG